MVKPPLRTKSIGFKVSEEEYAAGGPRFRSADISNRIGCPVPSRFCAKGRESRRPAARWFLGRAIPKRNPRPALVHSHRSGFVQEIESITAPAPLLRHSRQSSLHRIAMHIAELLYALLRRPYVEIVETGLPEYSSLGPHFKQITLARVPSPALG